MRRFAFQPCGVCAERPRPRPCLRKDYLDKLDKHLLHDRMLTEDRLYACTPGDSLLSVRARCSAAISCSACHGVCLSETGNNRHARPRAFQNTPCGFPSSSVSMSMCLSEKCKEFEKRCTQFFLK